MARSVHQSPLFISVATAIVVGIAGSIIFYSLAAASTPVLEAENATPTTTGTPPEVIDDSTASGSKALSFASASGHPGTTPPTTGGGTGTTPPATGTEQPTGVSGNWTMTFNDEFDGTEVDSAKWTKETSGGNNPDETACFDPSTLTVSGGSLDMALKGQSCQGKENMGGQMHTSSFKQVYGFYEARMNLPGSNGSTYNFPAFWIVPYSDGAPCWPTGGELDVMETIGGGAKASYGQGSSCDNVSNGWPHADPGGGDWTGWHTFAVDWEADSFTIYYDGKQVGEPIPSQGVKDPMNIILDNTSRPMGGQTVTETSVKVDYVRAWKKN